jgi:hypothetical protein
MLASGLSELLQGDGIKFLELLNDNLTRQIIQLNEQNKFLREQNEKLLDKIIGKEQLKVEMQDSEPIGGIKSLRTRIRDAELSSRIEAKALQDKEKERENAG